MELSGNHKTTSNYKTHIFDFWFRWPKVRLILWPCHYKAMGEKLNPSYKHQTQSLYHQLSYIRLLLMIQVQILVGDLHRGHLWSTEVTNRFLLIAHDWKELQTWAWCHCACLVETHRLICNMTYLGQHVTLTWGQILTLSFQCRHVYVSTSLAERNTTVPELCR